MDTETFTCECGEIHPLDPNRDVSTWCRCGLRMENIRALELACRRK